jgi:cytochrome b subunit of formate dehydrogenase
MKIAVYLTFFGFSTVKFLFTPFGGPTAGLTFLETYICCVAGAIVSSLVFYFSSAYFMEKAKERKLKKMQNLVPGTNQLPKKSSAGKKRILKIRNKFGIIGIAFFAPLILSIPLGSIIVARLYGNYVRVYLFILAGVFINGLATTGLAYAIAYGF